MTIQKSLRRAQYVSMQKERHNGHLDVPTLTIHRFAISLPLPCYFYPRVRVVSLILPVKITGQRTMGRCFQGFYVLPVFAGETQWPSRSSNFINPPLRHSSVKRVIISSAYPLHPCSQRCEIITYFNHRNIFY